MPTIAVVDTETCGFEATDPVCEFAVTLLTKEGDGWRLGETTSRLCRVEAMPPQARAVHHIRAQDTHAFPAFDPAAMWEQIKATGADAVAAHKWDFDALRFGEPQLPAICTLKASRRLWPDAPGHANGVLACWLEDEGQIALDDARRHPAHRAGPDTYVTATILQHMLTLTTGAQLVAWTKQPLVFHRWGFGKHQGQTLAETPEDYLRWVLRSDMDADTKWNCQREVERRAEAQAA
jgi:exodeoxyribonuclease X